MRYQIMKTGKDAWTLWKEDRDGVWVMDSEHRTESAAEIRVKYLQQQKYQTFHVGGRAVFLVCGVIERVEPEEIYAISFTSDQGATYKFTKDGCFCLDDREPSLFPVSDSVTRIVKSLVRTEG